jgi:hypothetical protein
MTLQDGREYKVEITSISDTPLEYLTKLSATHLMNAIDSSRIYCLYPRLTLNGIGLSTGKRANRHGIHVDDLNRDWTLDQCRRYCPQKKRTMSKDREILTHKWMQPLDRSTDSDSCEGL